MSTTLSSAAAAAALVGNSRDLVGEIFNRLPLSSVMRFRSVCKEWCSLTSTQSFIDMYQNINQPGPPNYCRAGGNNNSCFVVQYFDNGTESKSDHFNTLFFNLELDDDDNDNDNNMKMIKRIREYIHLSNIFSSQVGEDGNGKKMYKTVTAASNSFFHKKIKAYYHIKLISSSRGFLLFTAKPPAAVKTCYCMANMEEELEYPALILYNPVTKEQLTVIAPPLKYVYCGFYYHSPTKEHRILYRLMGTAATATADGIIATFIVIELKNDYNFIIRRINLKCPMVHTYFYYLPDISTPPVISNGSLHWIVSEEDLHGNIYSYPPIPECSHTILSFEMESEDFCWKKHPKLSHSCDPWELDSINDRRHKMNLLEMEGGEGLGLCDGYDLHRMNLLEIYVLVDYEKWTWVRRYSIDLRGYIDHHHREYREYGLHYKALQILQGDQLLLQVRCSTTTTTLNVEEYALYSLNHHHHHHHEKQLAADKKKKKKKRQVVNIDRCNKLGGRRLRRMIIKPDKNNKVVGNMVVLTPSLISIFQRNRSSTTTTTTEIPIKFIFIENGCRLIP